MPRSADDKEVDSTLPRHGGDIELGAFPATTAFEVAFFRLQVAIDCACRIERIGVSEPSWPRAAAAAIRAAFQWSAADPDAADALTNAALARGPAGVADHDRLIQFLAGLLESGRRARLERPALPAITERALAGGLASLVARRIEAGEAGVLPDLAGEAIQFALTPYVGAAAARLAASS